MNITVNRPLANGQYDAKIVDITANVEVMGTNQIFHITSETDNPTLDNALSMGNVTEFTYTISIDGRKYNLRKATRIVWWATKNPSKDGKTPAQTLDEYMASLEGTNNTPIIRSSLDFFLEGLCIQKEIYEVSDDIEIAKLLYGQTITVWATKNENGYMDFQTRAPKTEETANKFGLEMN